MRKSFCDSCGVEIKERVNVLKVPCHLYSLKHKNGYVDSEWNAISGRMDNIDLCNKCWNVAFSGALKAIGMDKVKTGED